MNPAIISGTSNDEYFTEEQCYITEISNSPQDPAVSIAQARVSPGLTTRWHCLKNTTERYLIISGQGLVDVGEIRQQAVNPGDVVLIPPECPQRIHNNGKTDLVFLAICSPRFNDGVYIDKEADLSSGAS